MGEEYERPETFVVIGGSAYFLADRYVMAAPLCRNGSVSWLDAVEIDVPNLDKDAHRNFMLAEAALRVMIGLGRSV